MTRIAIHAFGALGALAALALAACTEHGKSANDGGPPNDGGKFTPDAADPCASDGAFEPNDSLATAFQTPVDTTTKMVTFAGLVICSATDLDLYRIDSHVPQTVDAIVLGTPDSKTLSMSILNAAGTAVAVGVPGADGLHATLANAPAGTYFVRVAASALQGYKLTVAVK